MTAEELTSDFVINQAVFYLALIVSVGTVMGLGFQGFRWLRKKQAEDRSKELRALNEIVDTRAERVKNALDEMKREIVDNKEIGNINVKLAEFQGQLLKHEHILTELSTAVKELRGKINGKQQQSRR